MSDNAKSPTFCVLPFVAMNVHIDGGLAVCCYQSHDDVTHRFSDHQQWRQQGLSDLRHNLNSGVRDPKCARCWQLEDNGVKSYRQQWNENLQHYVDAQQHWHSDMPHDLQLLHLDFDNYCNLRCIMCHPQVSSSIETEYRQNTQAYEPFIGHPILPASPWHANDQFDQLMANTRQVDTLILTGGEPLINPKALNLIRRLSPEQLNLVITTNATQIRQEVYDLLASLKSSSVTVSLEGIGTHNDYLRYGSDWARLEKNIHWLSQLPNYRWVRMNINHTLQMTSAWSLPPLINWCCDHSYNFTINILTWPHYLSLACMPESTRNRLIDDLKGLLPRVERCLAPSSSSWLQGAIDALDGTTHDPDLTHKFYQYVAMLDGIRSTRFREVFERDPV